MAKRQFNWPLWTGLVLALFGFISYPTIFARYAPTRDFPWLNLILCAIAAMLLVFGVRRAFRQDAPRKSKIGAVVAATLSSVACGLLIITFFISGRELPRSQGAPHVGQKAPEFRLPDTSGNIVGLTQLLAEPLDGRPTVGVLLIFYRGYW